MSLPAITVPSGVPVFLADGHVISEDSVFAKVDPVVGHSRTRRVWTVSERVVSVRWQLEADQMARIESWFENDLLAGARSFSVEVRSQFDGPALMWWAARWVSFSTQMQYLGRGLLTGTLLLIGEPSATAPDTSSFAAEISIPLIGVRSDVATTPHFAFEAVVALTIPIVLHAEITIALIGQSIGAGDRITEAGDPRSTEDGVKRVIEG